MQSQAMRSGRAQWKGKFFFRGSCYKFFSAPRLLLCFLAYLLAPYISLSKHLTFFSCRFHNFFSLTYSKENKSARQRNESKTNWMRATTSESRAKRNQTYLYLFNRRIMLEMKSNLKFHCGWVLLSSSEFSKLSNWVRTLINFWWSVI